MLLKEDSITIRELTLEDKNIMHKWMNDERVLEWYEGRDKPFTEEMILEEFYESWEDEIVRVIIAVDNKPIGYGQVYRVYNEVYKAYEYEDKNEVVFGMDQFIGEPDYWGKGIGTKYIKMIFNYLMNEKNADAIITDPRVVNERAIRSYEKAGFKKLHIVKEHELHEGKHWDAWVMEYRK